MFMISSGKKVDREKEKYIINTCLRKLFKKRKKMLRRIQEGNVDSGTYYFRTISFITPDTSMQIAFPETGQYGECRILYVDGN